MLKDFKHFSPSVLKKLQAIKVDLIICLQGKQIGMTLIRLLVQKHSDPELPCSSQFLWQATTI